VNVLVLFEARTGGERFATLRTGMAPRSVMLGPGREITTLVDFLF